ncbi:MAG: FAD-dependent oxidoreductase [Saprospiraceae bacterium]|nr:FAD-dependent oxidoreductase [Saprospiraceae bacterium]MDG2417999.1 FAD-dependent oxidoreductase [Saprospiraceae bacterium]
MNLSYWEKESFFRNIDVAIIGSGIVGLSAAIRLKELSPKLEIMILERGSLPIGASTRNAGFACFGSMTELLDDLKIHSEDIVFSLVEKRWKGLLRLRNRVGDTNLKYKEKGGFELFRKEDVLDFQICVDQIDFFNKKFNSIIGQREVYKIASKRILDFGFEKIEHLIHNQAEGQIHTGEMMKTLLAIAQEKGVKILNGVSIKNLNDVEDGVELDTAEGWNLKFKKVLVATNGFYKTLIDHGDVIPARNQVIITKPLQNNPIEGTFHYDKGYFYFRNIDNRILLGGGRNLAKKEEETSEFGTTKIIQNALSELLKNVILPKQKFEIESTWSGILGVGQTKKPIVRSISKNISVAVRLGGMGVAIGSLVGEEGAELIFREI